MGHFRSERCSGFSLIEMVVAITVLGILSTSAAVFLRGPITSYFDTERRADLSDAGGLAMAKLTQDISSAIPATSNNVNVSPGFLLSFYSRSNPAQLVSYSCDLATGELRRNTGVQTDLLATNLTNCQARRFPAAGAPAQWVTLVLGFDNAGDRLTLYHTVRIDLP